MATDERKKKWKEEEKEKVSKREKGEGDAIQSLEACNFGNRVPACGKKGKGSWSDVRSSRKSLYLSAFLLVVIASHSTMLRCADMYVKKKTAAPEAHPATLFYKQKGEKRLPAKRSCLRVWNIILRNYRFFDETDLNRGNRPDRYRYI